MLQEAKGLGGQGQRGKGESLDEAGRVHAGIPLNYKLEMDFDWLLYITAPGVCKLLLNIPQEEPVSVQRDTCSHTQMEFSSFV